MIFDANYATLGTNHVSLHGNADIMLVNSGDLDDIKPFRMLALKLTYDNQIVYGNDVNFKIKVSGNGYDIPDGIIFFTINGVLYNTTVEKGTATLRISDLNAGNYNGYAVFDVGNNNYTIPTSDIHFIIAKVPVKIEAHVLNITYGDVLKIGYVLSGNDASLCNGIVYTFIQNKKYAVNVKSGVGELEIPNLNAGNYSINLAYDNGINYESPSQNLTFEVSKATVKMDITVNYAGDVGKIIIYITNNGKPLNQGEILTSIQKYYEKITDSETGVTEFVSVVLKLKNISVKNGTVMADIPKLDDGVYPCNITFDGGINCYNAVEYITLNIKKEVMRLNYSIVTAPDDELIVGSDNNIAVM